jgi:hypothetical protein
MVFLAGAGPAAGRDGAGSPGLSDGSAAWAFGISFDRDPESLRHNDIVRVPDRFPANGQAGGRSTYHARTARC